MGVAITNYVNRFLHFSILAINYHIFVAEVLKNTNHKSKVVEVDAVQTEKKSLSERNPEMVVWALHY